MKSLKMKFKKVLLRELIIYLLMLLALALIMHIDLLSDPSARLVAMQEKDNYTHPLLYSFVVYAVILILRKTIDLITGLFQKKTD